ncbi:hypothetical protein PLESTB_001789300 [Pleodorina starrii]|uniref:Glycosyl transferase CAP10 domain-containing protein n=1 Tax=Pleodorina starrii TaxID=330485 RepID=A0A9W6C0T8_9CHLO|nr:hypothetical protein PLESTM_001759800 [Pleodorina starrii]GLC61669.1 hypothetical protein PLESTB_001789300 [Pleodorina starrii]GLC76510.1 hypothetical protein PLESTF_001790700 [Pleodorina starrii]
MRAWSLHEADAQCQQNGAVAQSRYRLALHMLLGHRGTSPASAAAHTGPTPSLPPNPHGDSPPPSATAHRFFCSRESASATTAGADVASPAPGGSRPCRPPRPHHHRPHPSLLLLLLLPSLWLFLLLLITTTPPAVRADLTRYYGNVTYPLDEQLSYCATLDELYDGIEVDLRHWNDSRGISREAVDAAIGRYTTRGGQKGMALAFYGGVPYLIDEPKLAGLGHHVNILFTYMLVMLDLARQYGKLIPDLEFVIASSDRPLVLTAAQQPGLIPPVMRFCSSDEHADIKIPIFHFYTKKYTAKYLTNAEELAAKYPWGGRQPVVFGRFSKYYRYVHPLANSTLRRGAYNASICHQESPLTLSCPVRAHFMDWAARRHPELLDVKSGPRVSLEKHAQYKYLLHLDGQALSSRLEQLLPLRSLVLKEESGYKTFYYHLVRPYEHYIPVWKAGSGPEDVLGAVRWAMAHDQEAERMAAAAQAVALRYLSKRARSCYWLRLFQAYASLQRFPSRPSEQPFLVPVETYLETVGRSWEKGGQLHKIEY